MNENDLKYCKISKYRKNFSELETEGLLASLTASYIYGGECKLMYFLLNDDLKGFKKHIKYMNQEGEELMELVKNFKEL